MWTGDELRDAIPDDATRRAFVAELHARGPLPLAVYEEPLPVFDGWPEPELRLEIAKLGRYRRTLEACTAATVTTMTTDATTMRTIATTSSAIAFTSVRPRVPAVITTPVTGNKMDTARVKERKTETEVS